MIHNDKPLDAQLAYRLIYPLRNSWMTPNYLTTIRLLFGLLAAAGFATGQYAWSVAGGFCFMISNFLDHADGELARLTGNFTVAGHRYDLACDAIVNILLFVGIGFGEVNGSLGYWAIPMGIASGLAIAAIFHMRNEIEKNVGKTAARQPHMGKFEAEDVLYLMPVIAILEWLMPFLCLATLGAPLFALWVWREYKNTAMQS